MKKFRSPALLIIGLAVFCALLGCGKWGYKGKAYYKPLSPVKSSFGPYTLGVLPAEDKRGTKQAKRDCTILVLPLLPYCTNVTERPEKSTEEELKLHKEVSTLINREWSQPEIDEMHAVFAQGYPSNFSPSLFLQGSLVKEFEHSRIFESVIAIQEPKDLKQADLVLKPTLLSNKVIARYTYYMLSIPGALMSALAGLPVVGFSQEFDLKLELFQTGQEKPVWTGRVYEKAKGKGSPYYRTGFAKYGPGAGGQYGSHHGQPLNELLSRGMAKATPAIYDFLKKQPPEFWQELEHNRSQRLIEPPQEEAAPQQQQKAPSSMQDYIKQFQQELQEE